MKRGYTGQIGNIFVFVPAKNIKEAELKIEELSEGEPWIIDKTRNYKIL